MMCLSVLLPLIFIPSKSKAAGTYNPSNPFTYTYQDYPYWFSPESTLDMPENIGIYSDVLDYVIEIGASAQVLQFSSYYPFGFVLGSLSENIANYIFSLVINARIALGKAFSWVLPSNVNCVYAWQIKYLGVQDSYLDYDPNLYGPAYGWRFEGLLGEDIDVVLDQYGDFYGDNVVPHGNYTFTDQSEEIEWISVHQMNPSEDEIYVPNTNVTLTFNDLDIPYIQGKDLYFTIHYQNGGKSQFRVNNFVDTYISCNYSDFQSYPILKFWSPSATSDSYYTIDSIGSGGYREKGYMQNDAGKSHVLYISFYQNGVKGFNLPNYYRGAYGNTWPTSLTVNCKGLYDFTYLQGSFPALYLGKMSYDPVSDPVAIPTDVPVPFDDIPSDPTDYEPDPEPDPDPVPGADYPEPEPQPVPVPPIPPIVSGNDDIWPDLNVMFDFELDLDGFLGPLLNFDFPDFNTVIDSVLGPLSWISGIMSLLYEGSDFGILFTILAVFFIASAILGIYKWWNN